MSWFVRLRISIARRAALRAARAVGRCAATEPERGYICTVVEPHREHAASIGDRLVATWIDPADQVVR